MSTLIGGTTEPGGLRTSGLVRSGRAVPMRPLARRRDGGLGEVVTMGAMRGAGAGVATTATAGDGVSTRGGEAVGLGPVEAEAAVT